MIRKKIALIIVLSLLTPVFVAAQTPDKQEPAKAEEEKKAREETEKKALALVDEIIKEIQSFRLPENRIRIQVLLGDLLWKRDERRARLLFKQASDALIDLSAQTGSLLLVNNQQNILITQIREQLKQEVVNIIAQDDPKYARELLRSLRASQQQRSPNFPQYEIDYGQELRLASQIAATDPAQAFQIAEEGMSKGLNMELIGIFSQIASKDREMASKLLASIMKSLRAANLSENYNAASFALSLMQTGINSTHNDNGVEEAKSAPVSQPTSNDSPVLDEKVIKELMDMLTAAALSNPKPSKYDDEDEGFESYLLTQLNSMIKDVEKYVPSRAPQISKKVAGLHKKLAPEEKFYQEQQQLLSNGSVDEILESIKKAPDQMRDSLYQQASMKALTDGNESRARQIVNDHISDPLQRDQLLLNISSQTMWNAATQGKIEETRQALARVPADQQIAVLVQLANVVAGKGEKKLAQQLIDEARGLMSPQPTNYTELTHVLSIARAYANIEPMRSFEIIESIIDQLNTLISAAAVLDGFDYTRYFIDGEIIPHNSGLLTSMAMQCVGEVANLAKSDFDRAKIVADRFQRSELRILARLQVAQGVLSDKSQHTMQFPRNSGFVTITR